jgi:hypothetical protein
VSAAPAIAHTATDTVTDSPPSSSGSEMRLAHTFAHDWRVRSDRQWVALGEHVFQILCQLAANRGLPPPNQATAIVRMRADARLRARTMFGKDSW